MPFYVYPQYPSDRCVYCGETQDAMDHLIPRNYSGEADRLLVPVVPSCTECNSTLGDKYIPDVQDRRSYVQNRYRGKYRALLNIVWFGETDLLEFGPSLRTMLIRRMEQHIRLMSRLSWPHDPAFDADAWSSSWEEPISEDDLRKKMALRPLQSHLGVF